MRLIDADKLKASIEEKDRYNLGGECRIIVCGMLDDAPTIDAEPVRHGRWDDSYDGITPFCTACHRTHNCIHREPPFCPNCGAKMDGESE